MTGSRTRVLVNAGFRRYWTAQTISVVGDQISVIALPLVAVTVLQVGASQMGLLSAVGRAPLLIFGLLAGVWVDRADRRTLMIGCDLGRAVVVVLVPLAAVPGVVTMPLLMGVTFVTASLTVLFGIAATAYLPDLVARDRLIDANATLTQSRAVAQVAGPGVGGALVQLVTAPVAMIMDALTFVASAILLSRNVVPATPRPSGGSQPAAIPAVRQGMSEVWRNPLLRASAAAAATYNLFNAITLAVLVLHLSRGLRQSPVEIGVVLAAAGPGALLGAALAVPAGRRIGVGPVMISGLVLAGAAMLIIVLAAGPHPIIVLITVLAMFLNGLGQPFYNINQSGLRQAIVPAVLQGRVQATLTVLAGVAAPVGALAGGGIGQLLGTRAALLVAGLGAVAAAGWLVCSPIRRLRTLSDDRLHSTVDQCACGD